MVAKQKTKKKQDKEQKAQARTGQDDQQELTGEEQIQALVQRGKKKGFLTYEEMNDELPEDIVSPARLDSLLATLDEMGIKLLDEADVASEDDEDFDSDQEPEADVEAVRLAYDRHEVVPLSALEGTNMPEVYSRIGEYFGKHA